MADEVEETVSLQEALKAHYLALAKIASFCPTGSATRYHIAKAADRLVQAMRADVRGRVRGN